MVSILPSERTPFDVIGKDVGQALQSVLPQAMAQRAQRERGLQAINQAEKDIAAANGDPFKIALSMSKVAAENPNLERAIAPMYETALRQAQVKNAQKVSLPGQESPRERGPVDQAPERPQFPSFANLPQNQNFPTNIGPKGETGNIPQAATTGKAIPLLTPSEKRIAAQKLSKEYSEAGIPTTPIEALKIVNEAEEDKKLHNQGVEEERQQRVIGQQEYGQKAVDQLKKAFPESTPEMEAIFKQKGEIAASQSKSEAEIDKYLATEAKIFKNTISNVESDITAPRLQNKLQREFLGTEKDFNRAAQDLRVKLKPILDLGLYDTARLLLDKQGYYPEERETIINPFSDRMNTLMNKVPSAPKEGPKVGTGRFGVTYEKPKVDLENIKTGLVDLKKADPNFSLVLARKHFEDKNYGWREFKDALNELEQEGFELEDDQKNQRSLLDSPPLNTLEKILHDLHLIGR